MSLPEHQPPRREPILNLPGVVTALLALVIGIHLAREFLLTPDQDFELILRFAFIPARYLDLQNAGEWPGGAGALVWTFLTYALLHGGWAHLAMNAIWTAAFASPLAYRFGTARFLGFSVLAVIGGALAHLVTNWDSITITVGASAAVSGYTAAAARFLFVAGGPLAGGYRDSYYQPAAPIAEIVRNPTTVSFLAVWFGLNLFFGLAGPGLGLVDGAIAWEAHIGGFLVGFFAFPWLDPVGDRPPPPPQWDDPL